MVVLTTPAETECSVILYDILGRLRKTETIQTGSKEKTIQVEDLEAGIYLVDIKDNKNNRKRKLIIQRN